MLQTNLYVSLLLESVSPKMIKYFVVCRFLSFYFVLQLSLSLFLYMYFTIYIIHLYIIFCCVVFLSLSFFWNEYEIKMA